MGHAGIAHHDYYGRRYSEKVYAIGGYNGSASAQVAYYG